MFIELLLANVWFALRHATLARDESCCKYSLQYFYCPVISTPCR
jgi:hypothetical protein